MTGRIHHLALALGAAGLAACGDTAAGADASAPDARGSEVHVLATTDSAGDVQFDGQTIFWASHDAIWRIERDGTGQLELAEEPTGPAAIEIAGERVLWVTPGSHRADFNDGGVRSVGLQGGAVVELAGRTFPVDLAAHDGRVYWVEIDGGWLASAALDGGELSEHEWAEAGFVSVAASAAGLVWSTSGNATGRIMLRRPGGDTDQVLADGQRQPDDLALSGDDVFWTAHSLFDGEPATVVGTGIEGGEVKTLLTGLAQRPGIAVDGGFVYVADRAAGQVLRVPRAGGDPEVLADAQPSPIAVAAIGSALVFTCGDGSVRLLEL
jgi:hypothetical protein